jgi:cell shape-determining protein MreC
MEPVTALTIAKSAGEIRKKLYEFARSLKDREAKHQIDEILDELRELKQQASQLEDENRNLRKRLDFKSDE